MRCDALSRGFCGSRGGYASGAFNFELVSRHSGKVKVGQAAGRESVANRILGMEHQSIGKISNLSERPASLVEVARLIDVWCTVLDRGCFLR